MLPGLLASGMMLILTCASQKSILVLCLFSNACCSHLFLPPVKKFLIIVFLLLGCQAFAQLPVDTIARRDTITGVDSVRQDTAIVAVPMIKDTIRPKLLFPFTSDSFRFRPRLFFTFT